MKKIFLLIFFLLPFVCNSIELTTQDVFVFKVGIVDMDRILSEYSKSQKFQKELQLFKENKKVELAVYEKEIEDLIKKKLEIITEIEQLKQQIKQYEGTIVSSVNVSDLNNVKDSSDTSISNIVMFSTNVVGVSLRTQEIQQIRNNIESKQKNVEEIEKNIAEKKEILKQKEKEIELELEKMKHKYEIELFTELYDIIKKVAQQEELNIVIDKSGILYGESKIDLTEKVLKMLK